MDKERGDVGRTQGCWSTINLYPKCRPYSPTCLASFYILDSESSEELRLVPKVTQLVSGKANVWTQVWLISKPILVPPHGAILVILIGEHLFSPH